MRDEKKVVSVDTARRLQEVGFPLSRWEVERCWSSGVYPDSSSNAGEKVESLCYANESFKYETERLPAPDVGELIDVLYLMGNEMAIGYNDSGCFWHVRVGDKGVGNMLDIDCRKFDGCELDNYSLVEALAHAWIKFKE